MTSQKGEGTAPGRRPGPSGPGGGARQGRANGPPPGPTRARSAPPAALGLMAAARVSPRFPSRPGGARDTGSAPAGLGDAGSREALSGPEGREGGG